MWCETLGICGHRSLQGGGRAAQAEERYEQRQGLWWPKGIKGRASDDQRWAMRTGAAGMEVVLKAAGDRERSCIMKATGAMRKCSHLIVFKQRQVGLPYVSKKCLADTWRLVWGLGPCQCTCQVAQGLEDSHPEVLFLVLHWLVLFF